MEDGLHLGSSFFILHMGVAQVGAYNLFDG